MGSPTPSRAGPTSTEPRLPETTTIDRARLDRLATRGRPRRRIARGRRRPPRPRRRQGRIAERRTQPARRAARGVRGARGRRGAPARARVPHLDPGDRRRPRPPASWRSSGSRRPSGSAASGACSAGACASSSPTGSPAHGGTGDRLVVLAGPTAVGKGTVASYIRRHHPDVRLSRLGDDARAPARRGRGRALLLRRRRRVRPHGRGGASSSSGRPCTTPTATARRAGRSRRRSPPATACCSRSTSRARGRCARAMPEATLVFLLPPTWDELVRRLVGRGTERPAEQQRRLETAKVELAAVRRVRSPGREPRRRRGRARGRRLDEAPQGSALSCPGRKFPRTDGAHVPF